MAGQDQKSYEDQLGDELEALLGGGVDGLDDLAAGLNARSFKMPNGQSWTGAALEAELKRLGEN
jgi:hypothetical protein